jgi:hypothetical protein
MAASDYEEETQEAIVHRNASRASGRNVGSAISSHGSFSLNQSVKGLSIRDENESVE